MRFNVTSIKKDVKELETRDIVFSSPNRVGYTSKGDKYKSSIANRREALEYMGELEHKLQDNFLYCNTEYWCRGWKVKVVNQEHSWLSFNPMVSCYTGRIKDLKDSISKHNNHGTPLFTNYGQNKLFGYYRTYDEGQYFDGFLEVRIYQDRTMNVVWEVNWDGDKQAFFCLTKETAPLLKWWKTKQPVTPILGESVEDYLKRAMSQKESGETAWVPVFSNEEIRAKAFKDTAKERILERGLGVWGGDLDENIIQSIDDRCLQMTFSSKTKKLIYEFFDYEGNQILKNVFNQKHLRTQDRYYTRSAEEGICSLAFLESYLIIQLPSTKVKRIVAGEKNVDDIWDDFQADLAKNGLSLFAGKSMFAWQRQDRYIVGAYWENGDSNYWRNACSEAAVFVFDTKKKTRKFFRVNKETDTKDIRIPSLNNQICNYIQIAVKERWDKELRTLVPDGETRVVYLDNLTPLEMFAGTNVEWIINNKDQIGFNPLMYLANNSWGCRTITIPAADFGSTEGININNAYLIVLATTGDRLLEQLLKAKLFKLYFLGLYGICSAGSAGNMVFRQYSDKLRSYMRQRIVCLYKKGSNLKKMIGLDIAKLRAINDKIYISEGGQHLYRGVTHLTILPEALGMPMEEIARLDPVSWNRIISAAKENRVVLGDLDFEEAFKTVADSSDLQDYVTRFNGNIKKIISFYESFSVNDLHKLSDYWNMRKQLQTLQERVTTGEQFFDEKKYPEEVKKARRFVPYVQGMVNPNAWRNNVIDTPFQFREYINATFAFAGVGVDSIQYIEREGVLIGAAIKMNAVQNMNYLHDEMARWLSLYRDETKTKAFVEAVKRVSDFEYKDPETGLAMVPPRQCTDLNMEGKILDHCVASYVDPIINGTENILFIRRDENIDAPYFTMDLVPEKGSKSRFVIRQIHCYKNGDPTPEGIKTAYEQSGLKVYSSPKNVLGFVSKWIDWMKQKKKITVSNLVDHYGRLCAKRD